MVGDLIFSKLQATDQKVCQSQRAFYLLRKAFMRHFNLGRATLTPGMSFRNLIPAAREKDVWSDLQRSINARSWPDLVRPHISFAQENAAVHRGWSRDAAGSPG